MLGRLEVVGHVAHAEQVHLGHALLEVLEDHAGLAVHDVHECDRLLGDARCGGGAAGALAVAERAGAAPRDPKAPRDLADDIADAIASIRRSCDSRDRSAFSPIRKTLKSSLVDEK